MQGRILSAIAIIGALAIVAGAVFVVARTATELDEGESLATLSGVYNEVSTLKAGHLVWESGREGAALRLRDSVRTATSARATVSYRSGLILNVDPDSLLVVTAPRRDDSGVEVQEVLVASGGVRGEVLEGPPGSSRRVVEIVGQSGEVAARLTPTAGGGESMRYRVRMTEGGDTEVAVLAGRAEVESGGESVGVQAGQAVEISRAPAGGRRVSQAVQLPGFPESLSPAVDAQLRLDEPPAEVELRWRRVASASSHRVQVSRDFSFGQLVADAVVEADSFSLPVASTGTYFWRVASRDGRQREGEFGFARRFSVMSLPSAAAARAPAEDPEDPTEDDAEEDVDPPEEKLPEPPPSIATEVEFDFAGQVVGQGLHRQARGRGTFRPISGRVELNAQDVLQAERWSSLRLGSNATLQFDSDTRVELARAGREGGRRVLAVTLAEGGLTTDLGPNSALASVLVESEGQRITISGEGEGARVRTIKMDDRLRVVAERGETTVWAGGRQHSLQAGQALDRPDSGGAVSVVTVPANPAQSDPENGASFVTLDSPPEIVFSWRPVEGATSYRVRINSEGRLFFQGMTRVPRLVHTALPAGDYQWRVHALDDQGLESLEPASRSFSVVRDDRPPEVTVSSPADGATIGEDSVTVAGRTEPGVRVKINGRDVALDAGGRFQTEITLTPGVNQIVIEAVNRANAVTFKSLRIRRE